MCLLPFQLCISPFTWFYITEQYGLPSTLVDGVLGLTQAYSILGGYEPANDFPTESSYLEFLFLGGHISRVSFSTHFSQVFYDSYIDFGRPRVDGMSNESDKVTFQIEPGYYYSLEPQGVWFSNSNLSENKFYFPDLKIAVLSTGLSYNLVPSSY